MKLITLAKGLASSKKLPELKTKSKSYSMRKFKASVVLAAYLVAMDSGDS